MKYHTPVLLESCIEGLQIDPQGIYTDLTLGGAGHANAILAQLDTGRLIAFDEDPDSINNLPDDERIIFVRHNLCV